ncbi:MAG: class I SAM-dependent methyltransferase, partial [Gammaproteobacteria bacterium]
MNKKNPTVSKHYDAAAKQYHLQYDRDLIYNTELEYPANYFRLQTLLNSFTAKGIKRVVEVGVGEGTPLSTLARAGIDVWGFDISHAMVKKSKQRMKACKLDPSHIFWGDVQDPTTYIHALA